MKIQLIAIEKDGLIRVAVDGSITSTDFSPDAKNPLEMALGTGWSTSRALLDMTNATYIDSSAIGWLIGSSKAFRDGGGTLVIHSIQPAVRQVLDLLKIGRVVATASDESSARKIVMGAAA